MGTGGVAICLPQLLVVLLSIQSRASGHSYTKYSGLNCYDGRGGTNIDFSKDAPTGLSVEECQARCDDDAKCHCALLQTSNGKCYKRALCVPAQCQSASGFEAYVQNAAPLPPNSSRNVLYFVYDDMRPDLSFYGASWMHTPHLQKLADTGVVFDRAYVQQAVCSPSRNSFSTGRYPNSTKVWNFINNFRQASCKTQNHVRMEGVATSTGSWKKDPHGWGATATGGFAQCCTSCSVQADCVAWTYDDGACTLLASVNSSKPCPVNEDETLISCVSGYPGGYEKWTTLPQNFRENGYFTLGVGKYYHDGCRGRGGAPGDKDHPAGQGQPPMADAALSWTDGVVQFPDVSSYSKEYGSFKNSYGTGAGAYLAAFDNGYCNGNGKESSDYCTSTASLDGSGASGDQHCDFITYKDAIKKLQFAAENRRQTRQPFFQIVGIRRPHLNWYVPSGYPDLYPAENVSLPKQRTLDKSIDPIAFSLFPMNAPLKSGGGKSADFVKSPYESGTDNQLRELRRHYYAAVSWADYATGQVLDELDKLNLTDDTLVLMHSDHGWHLGEYGMWEKRSNWELGTRVPLVMRVPWLGEKARGKHARALVEIVDVYKTLCDIMGIPLPHDDVPVDGVSLRPILEDHTVSVKDVALTVHPRCKHTGMPVYGSRGLKGGADNTCLDVERTDFTWMGYTMRNDRYRYTEWVRWNGTTLSPEWSQLKASELYDHAKDTGHWTDPDDFENVNLAPSAKPELISQLSRDLHRAFGFPDELTVASEIIL